MTKKTQGLNLEQDASLSKVRDILVGSHVRETEKNFVRLEDRLSKETHNLREEVRRRQDALEKYIKSEVQSLVERMKSEQTERTTAIKTLAKELGDAAKGLESRLTKLDERLTNAQHVTRKQILEQSKTLRDEIEQAHSQLNAARDQAVSDLKRSQVDRALLGDLFTELSLRLKNKNHIRRQRR